MNDTILCSNKDEAKEIIDALGGGEGKRLGVLRNWRSKDYCKWEIE